MHKPEKQIIRLEVTSILLINNVKQVHFLVIVRRHKQIDHKVLECALLQRHELAVELSSEGLFRVVNCIENGLVCFTCVQNLFLVHMVLNHIEIVLYLQLFQSFFSQVSF